MGCQGQFKKRKCGKCAKSWGFGDVMTDRGHNTPAPARGKTPETKKKGFNFHRPPPHRPLLAGHRFKNCAFDASIFLGIGNGGGKQGRGNQPPYRRYGPDTEIFSIDPGSHTDWQKQAEFSSKGKPIRNFSIDPTSSIRTPVAGRCHFRDF